jgi:translocation and assembly module TamB
VTDPPIAPARRRRWWKYLLLSLCGAAFIALGLLWYINSDSFQTLVRRRLVAEIERITGGRAEIGSFHTIPFQMQIDLRDIAVHGRETAQEVPLAHADRLVARIKASSLLRTELGFHEVVLERPVIHIEVYADGSTNIPEPTSRSALGTTDIEKLLALSINRLEVRHGEVLWADQTVPVDFSVRDTELQMDYSFLRGRYLSRLLLGKVDTKFDDCRPFSWMTFVEFSLSSNFLDITSLKWNSGHSHLNAQGRISDFRHPHVEGSYDAHLDLTDTAAIARRRDLRGGMVDFKGHGVWSFEKFNTNGQLEVRDLGWQDSQIAFVRGSATSDYSLTEDQIKLSKLQGKIFGGSFAGEGQFDHWLSPPQHLPRGKNASESMAIITAGRAEIRSAPAPGKTSKRQFQAGYLQLRVRDLSAQSLAAGLIAPSHPLGRFSPGALVSGAIETRWRGTLGDADVALTLDAEPAGVGLPVTAHAQGSYHAADDSLDLRQLTMSTPATHLQASGSLSATSSLRVSLSTSNLGEWQPLIAAFGGPTPLPVTLNGNATFNGNVTGEFFSPVLSGALLVDDFDVAIPSVSQTPEQTIHWDSFSTSLQLSAHNIALRNSSLRHGETIAEFDASASLQDGHFCDSSAFNLRANLHDVDIVAVQALGGLNYPVSGRADLFVQASGTKIDPHGEGKLDLNDASFYGQPIQQFEAHLRFGQGEAAVDQIHLFYYDSVLTGSAAYNPSSRAFRVDLDGSNFDLRRFQLLQSTRLTTDGRADFTLKGSGTPESPSINADVHLRNLTLDGELAGNLDLQATTQGGQLHLTGKSDFQHGAMSLDGNIRFSNGYPTNVSMRMDHLDLDALWRSYFRGQLTGHSAFAGSLEMHGPLFQPGTWAIDGNLTDAFLDVENVKLHNQDPIRFGISNKAVHIERLHLLGQGTDFAAHGTVQLSGKRELDLTADGRVDLKLLSSLDTDFSASGLVSMNMTVGGTLTDPLPRGRLELANGAISYAGLPSGLSELNGALQFTHDRIHIESLQARTGGGTLDLKGDATNYNQQFSFSLTAVGKDVRLRYPPGVSSTANAELRWVGSRTSSTISGEIMVTKIAVTPGFDFSAYLERSRQISTVSSANSPLYNVKLDIHVQTAPELQMRTAVARLSGDADLRLRGSAAQPTVLGRADILEGQATFHGTKFTLERGDITFANPVAIEPQLNLQASTHVRSYDLNITVTGTPDRGLNVNYRSEPPLPQSDIIALLALGRTNQESEQLQEQGGQTAFNDQASSLILNEALNSTVSSRLQRLFGVSNIKIDPQGLNTETDPVARGPQITIEQEFANNLTLTYSTNVSQSSQQIIEGEYYFNRNLSAVGTRDQNGVVSFDLRIRRRTK